MMKKKKSIKFRNNPQQVLAQDKNFFRLKRGLDFDVNDVLDLSVKIYSTVYILLSCVKINSQFELP